MKIGVGNKLGAPRIKFCGITRPQDAVDAVRAGADAIGLQFVESSSRRVSLELAAQIINEVPPFVSIVGVFVNSKTEDILRAVEILRLDCVQLHGDEAPDFGKSFPIRTIKTVRVGGLGDLVDLDRYRVDALLFDAKVGDHYGGTGQRFDWSLLDGFASSRPLILAGGLCAENVVEAIRTVRPKVVDLCTGVEMSPGIKSYEKMRDFVRIVRGMDYAF